MQLALEKLECFFTRHRWACYFGSRILGASIGAWLAYFVAVNL